MYLNSLFLLALILAFYNLLRIYFSYVFELPEYNYFIFITVCLNLDPNKGRTLQSEGVP